MADSDKTEFERVLILRFALSIAANVASKPLIKRYFFKCINVMICHLDSNKDSIIKVAFY